ncbi:MAG: sulfate adenylyltransferase subunit CysN [Deltaproteobacteria bacterium]|nr:MAG: sulfate adenylyltransferase subunit CysN [Deltaproteobacteria bacterium]
MQNATEEELIQTDVEEYLRRYQQKELLRFVAVGSVDDGKSTLIGRLLHDTGMVYDDQLDAVKRATKMEGEEIDFSLITDGLKAEREQGITIDVAYRYFATEKRKFIIADTPGHVQYTRNMVTGASTANVALILIDARLGVLQQSRRHAYIASLLGIPHLAVCVNKMDLVGYDPEVYTRIKGHFQEFADDLAFKDVTFFPVSALKGINIVERSDEYTPWYEGGSVLDYLEKVPVATDRNLEDFRFPVQYVLRPHLNYRGFAGEIAAGEVKKGDTLVSLPSGKKSKVLAIDTYDGELESAHTPMSAVIRLEDEIDVSRGDMLVKADDLPNVSRAFDAHVVWMSERPLDTKKTYLIKHTTQMVRAQIENVFWKKDMDTLEETETDGLDLNDIGRVRVNCHRALYFDPYVKNRTTGAFVLVDSLSNNTVAAGMIVADDASQDLEVALRELRAGSALEPKTQVSPRERRERMGQKGAVVWLTGLPGSGRWTLAYALERRLFDTGRTATVVAPVDEDLRSMVSAAKAATDAGLITICAFASYHQADRDQVRARVGGPRFVHVYVNTPEALCRERRPDADFEGFEPPRTPDVTVDLESTRLDDAIEAVLESLEHHGQFDEL